MREIVVKSSNRGAAHLGVLLGEQSCTRMRRPLASAA